MAGDEEHPTLQWAGFAHYGGTSEDTKVKHVGMCEARCRMGAR